MDIEIKKLADSGDLKSLKYIFVDALDVDPTFVRYEEEYNYCKSIPGLLEPYQELTPFTENKASWNEAYWTKLKMDLVKNFSDKRMTHMREVAKVFLADKIQRILVERSASIRANYRMEPDNIIPNPVIDSSMPPAPARPDAPAKTCLSKAEEQELKIREEKERLESENKALDDHIRDGEARRERLRSQGQDACANSSKGIDSKKIWGVAVAAVTVIVAAAVVVVIILLLK